MNAAQPAYPDTQQSNNPRTGNSRSLLYGGFRFNKSLTKLPGIA